MRKQIGLILLLLIAIPCNSLAQSMLGRRLSVSPYVGLKPMYKQIYNPLFDETVGSNPPLKELEISNFVAAGMGVSVNYILSKWVELSASVYRSKHFGVVYTDNFNLVSFYSDKYQQEFDVDIVPFKAAYKVALYDLGFRFYQPSFSSGCPDGAYYKVGVGVSRFKGDPDMQRLEKNTELAGFNSWSIPRSEIINSQDSGSFSALAMHVSYGVGIQRFYSHRFYFNVGVEGSLPVGVLFNEDGFIPQLLGNEFAPKSRYVQNVMGRSAFSADILKVTVRVGYMLF